MKGIVKKMTLFLLILSFLRVSAQSADTITFEIDTVNSYVAWNCDSHHGTVPLQSGIIKTVDNNIVSGGFQLKMDSIKDLDIDYPLMRHTLENTLRSEFFFDVKEFPTSTFNIDYVISNGSSKTIIAGDLWIRGLVNCVRFTASVNFDDKTFQAVSDSFNINRIDWNITIYSKQEAKSDESVIISDSIGFVVHLKGYRKED